MTCRHRFTLDQRPAHEAGCRQILARDLRKLNGDAPAFCDEVTRGPRCAANLVAIGVHYPRAKDSTPMDLLVGQIAQRPNHRNQRGPFRRSTTAHVAPFAEHANPTIG